MSIKPAEGNFAQKIGAMAWHHFDIRQPDVKGDLKKLNMDIPEAILEAMVAKASRPRFAALEDGFLLILRGINTNNESHPEDMVSVRLWSDGQSILTTSRRPLKAIAELQKMAEDKSINASPIEFALHLLKLLEARITPTVDQIQNDIEGIEDIFINDYAAVSSDTISDLRRKIIMMERYLAPQRVAIEAFSHYAQKSASKHTKLMINEQLDAFTLAVEELEEAGQRAQLIKDEVVQMFSEKLTHNTYLFTIIAAIFLPLTFVTGLLGINVAGIPSAENSNAFFAVIGILVVIVVVQIVIFKKKGWF